MSFLNEKWLAVRAVTDGGGTGTPADPFCVLTPESFANRIRVDTYVNEVVRLGPGIFRTRGVPLTGFTQLDPTKEWRLKSGQRLVGAGMFSTTVQLVWDWDLPLADEAYQPGIKAALVTGITDVLLESAEITDLTLDCNLQRIPEPFGPTVESGRNSQGQDIKGWTSGTGWTTLHATSAFFTAAMVGSTVSLPTFEARIMSVAAGGMEAEISNGEQITQANAVPFKVFGVRLSVTAISLLGANIRLRRVRVINFGTQTPLYFDGVAQPAGQNRSAEGFPLRIEGRTVNRVGGDLPAFNSWMEDCVVEQPYPSSGREVTFVVGGGVATNANPALTKLHLEPFGCGIRKCYMNFDLVNPLPGPRLAIGSFVIGNGSTENITVTTVFPHRFYPGEGALWQYLSSRVPGHRDTLKRGHRKAAVGRESQSDL